MLLLFALSESLEALISVARLPRLDLYVACSALLRPRSSAALVLVVVFSEVLEAVISLAQRSPRLDLYAACSALLRPRSVARVPKVFP